MNIITKFTVVTEQGIDALLLLTRAIALEKFSGLLSPVVLDDYIETYFNERTLIAEVNSMSNQWLVVYADDQPAGYVKITSKGKKPGRLHGRRTIRIADFGVLKKYMDPAIRQSLFDKCMAVCKAYDALWINEYVKNPLVAFFQAQGFLKENGNFQYDELPLPSCCLVKDQKLMS